MKAVGVGGWIVLAGVALRAIAPLGAQAPTDEQALIDRAKQIQGQLAPGTPQAPQGAPREQELIEQTEAIRGEVVSEAAAGERPALSEDEVRTLLHDNLGVDILRIEPVEREGRPAYAVTVMEPPGNDNAAFAVSTLLVDGMTGGLLGRVPQTPRVGAPGPEEAAGQADPDSTGPEIRRRTYR